MIIQEYDSGPTSNDLLESRVAENNSAVLDDSADVHSVEDVANVDDLLAVSKGT
jgi:hypothetical protein